MRTINLSIKNVEKTVIMTNDDLKAWQAQMSYTQAQAANALGISRATYIDMSKGISRNTSKPVIIDLRTALACAALAKKLKPWPEK